MSKRIRSFCVVVLALTVCAPLDTAGCTYCLTPSGGFKLKHPESIAIAVAIHRELDSGLLTKPAAGKSNKLRSSDDSQLWAKLTRRNFLANGFEVLLIEDGVLHRVDAVDKKSKREGRIRLVTGRAVLRSLLDRRLHLETAVCRGLVIVEPTSTFINQSTDPAKTVSK
jgi:hypothetical protein